jgi:hypothetical protein
MHLYIDLFTPDFLPLPPCELLVIVDDRGQRSISFRAGLVPAAKVRFSFGFFVDFRKTPGPVNVDARPIGMQQPVELLNATGASHLGRLSVPPFHSEFTTNFLDTLLCHLTPPFVR